MNYPRKEHMRGSFLTLACAMALIAGVALAAWQVSSPTPARALTNCDTTEAGITPAEQTMLDLINAARTAAGVQPLKFSPNLDRAAAWKSADSSAVGLYPQFNHTDSLGRTIDSRFRDCGYTNGGFIGENIAQGSGDPNAIFALFMASDGHRANILNVNYRVVGIAVHGGAWTQDFGARDDSNDTSSPAPSPTPSPTPSPSPSLSPSPSPSPIHPIFRVALPDLTHE